MPFEAPMNLNAPSPALAGALMQAFDHFNGALFGGVLPAPVFVWQRKKGCRGQRLGRTNAQHCLWAV